MIRANFSTYLVPLYLGQLAGTATLQKSGTTLGEDAFAQQQSGAVRTFAVNEVVLDLTRL